MRRAPLLRHGRPLLIAHRGASADRPENTTAAFDEALTQGCDGFECDVQVSADGVPFLYHDRTLARVGRRGRRVAELDAQEIARLDAGRWFRRASRGARLLTLERFMERYAGSGLLLVEIKARPADLAGDGATRLATFTSEILLDFRRADLYVLCFERVVLDAIARVAPRLPRVLNVSHPPARLTAAFCRGLAALSVNRRRVTPGLVSAAHRRDLPVMVYTCNTPADLARARAAGVDVVMTDRPGWARLRLERP